MDDHVYQAEGETKSKAFQESSGFRFQIRAKAIVGGESASYLTMMIPNNASSTRVPRVSQA